MASSEQVGNIVYQVEMEVEKLIEAQRKVNERLDKMNGGAAKAGKTFDQLQTSINKVAGAIAASVVVDWGRAFLVAADNMNQLNARITRLTGSSAEASATMQSLVSISSATGSSLQDTQKLWETLNSALRDTGATNGQITQLTETLQKIGRIGGSSTEEMAAALRQFGQSISSGVVRAEEFNSILEQMPELARQMAAGLGVSVGELRQLMLDGKLTAQDALNAIQRQTALVNSAFSTLPRTMSQANTSLTNSFLLMVDNINKATGASNGMVLVIDSLAAAIGKLTGQASTASQQIADLRSEAEMYSRRARTWGWIGFGDWQKENEEKSAKLTAEAWEKASRAGWDAVKDAEKNAKPIQIKSSSDDAATKKLVQNSERRLELAKLEGEARARLQAQYDAADAGITDQKRIRALQDEYAQTYRVTEARKESNKAGKQSTSQAEAISQKLANLKQQSELAAGSTQELSREQAILAAQQSLGKGATQEQIKLAGEYKAKAWDAAAAAKGVTEAIKAMPAAAENKSFTDSMDNLKAALNAGEIDLKEYNAATEKLAQEHQNNLAKINAKAQVNPVASARADVDPVQQLVNENNQKLELMQQYQKQEQAILQQSYQTGRISYDQFIAARSATDAQYLALKTAQEKQFNEQMMAAQWQLLSQQGLGYEMLTSAVDAFSGNASNAITGLLTGTMSAQQAMQSLGSTILNSVINSIVQMGVEAMKNYIIGQTLGGAAVASSVGMAATTASAWAPAAAMASLATLGANAAPAAAGITSTVGIANGLALAGMRKNGGPVSAGSMYQVGEGGKPEIYRASTGKQYMIPGDNGKVISNREMQSGGGVNVKINVVNQSSGATVQSANGYMQDGSAVVDLLLTDIESGGPFSSQIQSTFGLRRQANGAY